MSRTFSYLLGYFFSEIAPFSTSLRNIRLILSSMLSVAFSLKYALAIYVVFPIFLIILVVLWFCCLISSSIFLKLNMKKTGYLVHKISCFPCPFGCYLVSNNYTNCNPANSLTSSIVSPVPSAISSKENLPIFKKRFAVSILAS